MINLRKSNERGHANHGWLDSYHTFSFADYYDPQFMGFSVLRVINEDRIAESTGFGMHGHRDMEIITYVIEGELQHKDSMGNTSIILPGEIQRMSAGTGVKHSEFNHSSNSQLHLLQIWIEPNAKYLTPSYDQKSYLPSLQNNKDNKLIQIVSFKGGENAVSLNQDIEIFLCKSKSAGKHQYHIAMNRNVWVQMVSGELNLNNYKLTTGDGAAITSVDDLNLDWTPNTEFLLFDLP